MKARDTRQTVSPELIGIRDVAVMLNVSTQTVRRLVARGELPPPIKLGGSIRWPVRLLNEWLAKKMNTEEANADGENHA